LKLPRVVNRQPNRILSPASINRTIELLRHMMNWAVGREYLERTPFRRGSETLIRKQHEDNRRRRRLSEDEEVRLLAVATPFLRSMIIAALDTGLRQGEMLALQFGDIDENHQVIVIRGETTKSKKTRVVPISTSRLKAVLEWLRLDADGEKKPAEALVFSDEIGEPIGRFRTAWVTAVLRAHGVKPEWKSYNWTALTPTCQQAFKRINLHWHDLRHEYASRLVERGVPLAQVRDLLGHASITTTERYDNQRLENLQAAVLKLESGKSFDATDTIRVQTRIDDADKVSSFFQEQAKVPGIDDQESDRQIQRKRKNQKGLDTWLGGRDSNPDTVVQSHVSYRWTTSQYQSGAPEGQETSIIAYGPQAPAIGRAPTRHWDVFTASRCRSPMRTVRRRSRCPLRPTTIRCRPAAVVCGGGSPCRPCAPPRALPRWSTRAPCPSDAPPCRPCSRSRAVCFDPSKQIRDLPWPPLPPRVHQFRAREHSGCNRYATARP
jgi:integrase